MKKKILYIALVLICLSIITGGTLSYFAAGDTARNVITSGGIDVKIVEQQLVDGKLLPYPETPVEVMPATTVSKIVSVQNVEETAWVRVSYTVTVYDSTGKVLEVPADELEKVIVISPDSENWTEKDGWWYCNAALGTGESSAPLFEEVVFSGAEMDNKYQNCTTEIDVVAQAVQAANNGSTVFEALGWADNK